MAGTNLTARARAMLARAYRSVLIRDQVRAGDRVQALWLAPLWAWLTGLFSKLPPTPMNQGKPSRGIVTLEPRLLFSAVPFSELVEDYDTWATELRVAMASADKPITGVTVVTHGFQLDGEADGFLPLARAIATEHDGYLLDYDVVDEGAQAIFDPAESGLRGSGVFSGELVIAFDWAVESNERSAGWGEAAGDALFTMLVDLGVVDLDDQFQDIDRDQQYGVGEVPLHFIAHSFGTAVTSEAVERLAAYDIPVDQVTYLDPHDFNEGLAGFDREQRLYELGQPEGYGAVVWDNVYFTDAYYQTRSAVDNIPDSDPNANTPSFDFIVPSGRPIPGAYNVFLADGGALPAESRSGEAGIGGDHSYVWNAHYLATITGAVPTVINNVTYLDLQGDWTQPQNNTDPADNYRAAGPAVTQDYTSTGFAFSRLGDGSASRPDPTLYTEDANANGTLDPGEDINTNDTLDGNQDHQHSSVTIRNAESDERIAWTQFQASPRWNPFTIVNGDFENALGGQTLGVGSIRPGWSHHGGGGEASFLPGPTDTGYVLSLKDGESRTHNRIVVPADNTSLTFDLSQPWFRANAFNQPVLAPTSGELVILLNGIEAQRIALADLPWAGSDQAVGSLSYHVPVNAERGSAVTVTFEVQGAQAHGATPAVSVDNLRWQAVASGTTQAIVAVDLSEQVPGGSFSLRPGGELLLPDGTTRPLTMQPDLRGNLDVYRVDLPLAAPEYLGKILLPEGLAADDIHMSFQDGGRFWFAPAQAVGVLDTAPAQAGFQGTLLLDVDVFKAGQTFAFASPTLALSVEGSNALPAPPITADVTDRLNVARVQLRLNALDASEGLGAYRDDAGAPLDIDGILGPKTSSVLRKFQAARGLAVTGTLDDKTLYLLNHPEADAVDAQVGTVSLEPYLEPVIDGLDQLVVWLEEMASAEPLTQALPGLGLSLAQAVDPLTGLDEQVQASGVGARLYRELFSPMTQYLADLQSSPGPHLGTVGELVDFVNALDGVTMNAAIQADGVIKFDLQYDVTRSHDVKTLDFASALGGFDFDLVGELDLTYQSSVTYDVSFGFDRSVLVPTPAGNGVADGNRLQSLRVYNNALRARVNIDTDPMDTAARIGFLGLDIVDGTLDLDADITLQLDASERGYRTGGELIGSSAADFAAIAAAASYTATLPLRAMIGGQTVLVDQSLVIADSAVYEPGIDGLSVTLPDLGDWSVFLDLSPQQWLDVMGSLGDAIAQLNTASLSGKNLALLADGALGSILDFGQALREGLLNGLETELGVPSFVTIQDFIAHAGELLGLGESALRARVATVFDALGNEQQQLLIDLVVTHDLIDGATTLGTSIAPQVTLATPLADLGLDELVSANAATVTITTADGTANSFTLGGLTTLQDLLAAFALGTGANPVPSLQPGVDAGLLVNLRDASQIAVRTNNAPSLSHFLASANQLAPDKVVFALDEAGRVVIADLTTGPQTLSVQALDGSTLAAELGLLTPEMLGDELLLGHTLIGRVAATWDPVRHALVLTDLTQGGSVFTVDFTQANAAALALGIDHADLDGDGRILGSDLRGDDWTQQLSIGTIGSFQTNAILSTDATSRLTMTVGVDLAPLGSRAPVMAGNTLIAQLNGGAGVLGASAGNFTDLFITTRDGSEHVVRLENIATLQDVIDAIQVGTADEIEVDLDPDAYRIVLTDTTHADYTTGEGLFEIRVQDTDPDDAANNLAGLGLGIVALDEDGDGVIRGTALHGDTWASRLFVQDVALSGNFRLAADDIAAQMIVGPVQAAVGDGTFSMSGSFATRIERLDDAEHDRVYLNSPKFWNEQTQQWRTEPDLYTAAFGQDDRVGLSEPVVAGDALLELSQVSVDGGLLGTIPPTASMRVAVPDLLEPASVQIDYDADLSGLKDFEAVSAALITQGLREAAEKLDQKIFGQPIFNQTLPLIDKSLNDLIGLQGILSGKLAEAQAAGPITLQRIQAVLDELFTDGEQAQTTTDPKLITYRLTQAGSSTGAAHVGLDLDSLAPGNLLLGGIRDLVDIEGAGVVQLDTTWSADLGFAIDLTDPLAPQVYILDDGFVEFTALADADQTLNFKAAAGPLGLFVKNGSLQLDDGSPGPTHGPAVFRLDLAQDPSDHRYSPTQLLDSAFVPQVIGGASVDLPVAFPTLNNDLPTNLSVQINDLADPLGPGTHLTTPDLASALEDMELFDFADPNAGDVTAILDGLDYAIELLDDAIKTAAFGQDLPFVGGELAKAVDVFKDLRDALDTVRTELGTGQVTLNLLQAKLYEVLVTNRPVGQALLRDIASVGGALVPDGQLTLDDLPFNAQDTDTDGFVDDVAIRLPLGMSVQVLDAQSLAFDLGIPGFGLEANGGFDLSINALADLTLGVSLQDGFYLDTQRDDELALQLHAELPAGFDVTGKIGFLEASITQIPGQSSTFDALFTVDLIDPAGNDARLTLDDINSAALGELMQVSLAGLADIDLALQTGLGIASLPSISAGLHLDWTFDALTGQQWVELVLDDAALSLGDLLDGAVRDTLGWLNNIIDPLDPILDVLMMPVPGLSELLGRDFTLVDLAKLTSSYTGLPTSVFDFIDAVNAIRNLLNSGANALTLDLGELRLSGVPEDFGALADGFGTLSVDETALADASSYRQLAEQSNGGYFDLGPVDISYPLLENPLLGFQLLLGQDVSVVEVTMPDISLGYLYTQYWPFPPFPWVGMRFNAGIDVSAQVSVGFDTYGMRRYAADGFTDPLRIADGFYVNDLDGPEAQLRGELSFGVEATANIFDIFNVPDFSNFGVFSLDPIFRAGVKGGLFADLDVQYADYDDGDGDNSRLRVGGLIDAGFDVFDTSGDLSVDLRSYVQAGYRLSYTVPKVTWKNKCVLSWGGKCITKTKIPQFSTETKSSEKFWINEETTHADAVLIDFNHQADLPEPPVLATYAGDGVWELNMGPNAHRRGAGTGREDEFFVIAAERDDTVIRAFGYEMSLGSQVTKIVADAGPGNDSITVVGRNAAFDIELHGGAGNDRLYYRGSGNAQLFGDAGNDTLTSGSGNDLLVGGAGEDQLNGGDGDDTLQGDAGAELLDGGLGADHLDGGDGDDMLIGGRGGDTILGGLGADLIRGGWGNDTLDGSAGNDFIEGNQGNDIVAGGDGDDTLFGGTEADTTTRYSGTDTVFGGAGNDQITLAAGGTHTTPQRAFGHDGDDIITGGEGVDVIHGGAGNDEIKGLGGADQLYGFDPTRTGEATSTDILFGGEGDDQLVGSHAEDILFGESGNDVLIGAAGDDALRGGAGDDDLFAGRGSDLLAGGLGGDWLEGGEDADVIHGNAGADIIWGDSPPIINNAALARDAFAGPLEPIVGSSIGRPQFLVDLGPLGTSFNASPDPATDGDDQVFAGSGSDWVFGGAGSDTLEGGDHDDYLDGGAGYDRLMGQGDFDTLLGGLDDDAIYLGDQKIITHAIDVSVDAARAGQAWGNQGADLIFGTAGNDTIDAGTGDDTVYALLGSDAIIAGPDTDPADGSTDDDTVYAGIDALGGGIAADSNIIHAGYGNDQVFGDVGNDVIRGGLGDDQLVGLAGDDLIEGGAGDDDLAGDDALGNTTPGNSGNDTLFGGAGRDELYSGAGLDTVVGGSDADILIIDANSIAQLSAGVSVINGHGTQDQAGTDAGPDSATDTLRVLGTAADDHITFAKSTVSTQQLVLNYNGTAYALRWSATDNSPLVEQFEIVGLSGDDVLGFEQNADALDLAALGQANAQRVVGLLRGGDGHDVLIGSAQRDLIIGGAGDDLLFGLQGNDRLWGDDPDDPGLLFKGNDALFTGAGSDDAFGDDGQSNPALFGNDLLFAGQRTTEQTLLAMSPNDIRDLARRMASLKAGVTLPVGVQPLSETHIQNLLVGQNVQGVLGNNRLNGEDGSDRLYAGYGLDFLFGGAPGGIDSFGLPFTDRLFGRDGQELTQEQAFESAFDFARTQSQVWYFGGTDNDDSITLSRVNDAGPDTPGVYSIQHTYGDVGGVVVSVTELRVDDNAQQWQSIEHNRGTPASSARFEDYLGGYLGLSDQLIADTERFNVGAFDTVVIESKAGNDTVLVRNNIDKTVWTSGGDGDDVILHQELDQPLADTGQDARRDVILGGAGNDVLLGSAGEDWVFGGEGDDLLMGGRDGQLSDQLFGGEGDDVFQLLPDHQAEDYHTPVDRFFGGAGIDQVYYRGATRSDGTELDDYVVVGFDATRGAQQIAVGAWGGVGGFIPDPEDVTRPYMLRASFRPSTDVERFVIQTGGGNDIVHADPGFSFDAGQSSWGLDESDLIASGLITQLIIDTGDGEDRVWGGADDDLIFTGAGNDLVVGGPGNDRIESGGGDDEVFGDDPTAPAGVATPMLDAGESITLLGTTPQDAQSLIDSLTSIVQPVDLEQVDGFRSALSKIIALHDDPTTPVLDIESLPGLSGIPDSEPGFAGDQRVRGVGDFNGDGYNDLLIVPGVGQDMRLVFGPLDAERIDDFNALPGITFDAAFGMPADRMGDLNGDGLNDLVFVRAPADAPTVDLYTVYGADNATLAAALAAPDALLTPAPASVLQDVTQAPAPALISAEDQMRSTVIDWDGDGLGDVVLYPQITIFENNDNPVASIFARDYAGQPMTLRSSIEFAPWLDYSVITSIGLTSHGDLDGDGFEDLIITEHGYGFNYDYVSAQDPNESNSTISTAQRIGLLEGQAINLRSSLGDDYSVAPLADVDLYEFELKTGQTLAVDVDGSFDHPDSRLRIFDSSGNQLLTSDDDQAPDDSQAGLDPYLSFVAPADGVYYVGHAYYAYADYNIQSHASGSVPAGTPQDLSTRHDIIFSLNAEPHPAFGQVSLFQGKPFWRTPDTVTLDTADLVLTGVSPFALSTSEIQVTSLGDINNDGLSDLAIVPMDGPGSEASIIYGRDGLFGNAQAAPLADYVSHTLAVGADQFADETEANDTLDAATRYALAFGGTLTIAGLVGETSATQPVAALDVDLFGFELLAGRQIDIAVNAGSLGSTLDPYLRVFDAAGSQIDFDDDSGPGADALLSFTPQADGVYYLGVSAYPNNNYQPGQQGSGQTGNTTGTYQLIVSDPGVLVITDIAAGDYNWDGVADLAVRLDGEPGHGDRVVIFDHSHLQAAGLTYNLSAADRVLGDGTDEIAYLAGAAQFDLNGDHLPDLMLGVNDAGTRSVRFVPGQREAVLTGVALENALRSATRLETSNGFVLPTNPADGPARFDPTLTGGGAFTLDAADPASYFVFTTRGAGGGAVAGQSASPDHAIRITSADDASLSPALNQTVRASAVAWQDAPGATQPVVDGDVVIINHNGSDFDVKAALGFDLSMMLGRFDTLDAANLTLNLAGTAGQVMRVSLVGVPVGVPGSELGFRPHEPSMREPLVSDEHPHQMIADVTLVGGDEQVQLDITQWVELALQQGVTRLGFVIEMVGEGELAHLASPGKGDASTRLELDLRRSGAVADLYDLQGRLLAQDQTVIGMQGMEAGTYILAVHDVSPPVPGEAPTRFGIEITPPAEGATLGQRADDVIDAGAGNDTVIAGPGLDGVRAGTGVDTTAATNLEITDDAPVDTQIAVGTQQRPADPNPRVSFTDPQLEDAIADQLGISFARGLDRPIYTNDLDTLTELDAGYRNIQSLQGIAQAVNLSLLNLAGNQLDMTYSSLDELQQLELRDLSLASNYIIPPGPVQLLATRSLDLDDQSYWQPSDLYRSATSDNGRYYVTPNNNTSAWMHDLEVGIASPITVYERVFQVLNLLVSNDGTSIVISGLAIPDGTELIQTGVFRVDLTTDSITMLPGTDTNNGSATQTLYDVSSDGRFALYGADDTHLYRYDHHAGQSTLLLTTEPGELLLSAVGSDDGKRVVFETRDGLQDIDRLVYAFDIVSDQTYPLNRRLPDDIVSVFPIRQYSEVHFDIARSTGALLYYETYHFLGQQGTSDWYYTEAINQFDWVTGESSAVVSAGPTASGRPSYTYVSSFSLTSDGRYVLLDVRNEGFSNNLGANLGTELVDVGGRPVLRTNGKVIFDLSGIESTRVVHDDIKDTFTQDQKRYGPYAGASISSGLIGDSGRNAMMRVIGEPPGEDPSSSNALMRWDAGAGTLRLISKVGTPLRADSNHRVASASSLFGSGGPQIVDLSPDGSTAYTVSGFIDYSQLTDRFSYTTIDQDYLRTLEVDTQYANNTLDSSVQYRPRESEMYYIYPSQITLSDGSTLGLPSESQWVNAGGSLVLHPNGIAVVDGSGVANHSNYFGSSQGVGAYDRVISQVPNETLGGSVVVWMGTPGSGDAAFGGVAYFAVVDASGQYVNSPSPIPGLLDSANLSYEAYRDAGGVHFALSPDGSKLASVFNGATGPQFRIVDLISGQVQEAIQTPQGMAPTYGGGNGPAVSLPHFSGDGRYLTFSSRAIDLVEGLPAPTGQYLQAYLLDTLTGDVSPLSLDHSGQWGQGQSVAVGMSEDSSRVAVWTEAANLTDQQDGEILVIDTDREVVAWRYVWQPLMNVFASGPDKPDAILDVAFSADLRTLAFLSGWGTIEQGLSQPMRIYFAEAGEPGYTGIGQFQSLPTTPWQNQTNSPVTAGLISPDGSRNYFVTADRNIAPFDDFDVADLAMRDPATGRVQWLTVGDEATTLNHHTVIGPVVVADDGSTVGYTINVFPYSNWRKVGFTVDDQPMQLIDQTFDTPEVQHIDRQGVLILDEDIPYYYDIASQTLTQLAWPDYEGAPLLLTSLHVEGDLAYAATDRGLFRIDDWNSLTPNFEPLLLGTGLFDVAWDTAHDTAWLIQADALAAPGFGLYQVDLLTGQKSLLTLVDQFVSTKIGKLAVAVSSDGSQVAFTAHNAPPQSGIVSDQLQVYLYDTITGDMRPLYNPGDAGPALVGDMWAPVFTADGSRLSVLSDASVLDPRDTNGVADLFVYDMQTGAFSLESISGGGGEQLEFLSLADWPVNASTVVSGSLPAMRWLDLARSSGVNADLLLAVEDVQYIDLRDTAIELVDGLSGALSNSVLVDLSSTGLLDDMGLAVYEGVLPGLLLGGSAAVYDLPELGNATGRVLAASIDDKTLIAAGQTLYTNNDLALIRLLTNGKVSLFSGAAIGSGATVIATGFEGSLPIAAIQMPTDGQYDLVLTADDFDSGFALDHTTMLPIVFDTASPLATPLPYAGEGYIDVEYTDALAGLDDATVAIDNIIIPGVSIDRAQRLPGALVRYHYADDGDPLPDGELTLQLGDNPAQDLAGNAAHIVGSVIVDSTAPTAELSGLSAQGVLIQQTQTLDIVWRDPGTVPSGIDPASIGIDDIAIDGLVVTDAQIVASEPGDRQVAVRYTFDGVLPDGLATVNAGALSDHAGNAIAAGTIASFAIETSPPIPTLVWPGATFNTDLGYIDLRWTDSGAFGVDPSTIGVDDVAIPGVTVDRVEQVGPDTYRYVYSAFGDGLIEGPTTITVAQGVVSDLGGNPSVALVAQVQLDRTAPTGNLADPTIQGTSAAGQPNGIDFLQNPSSPSLRITWSEPIQPASVSPQNISLPGVAIASAQLQPDLQTVVYTLDDLDQDGQADLLGEGRVQVSAGASPVLDLAGNPAHGNITQFSVDRSAPVVSLVSPASGGRVSGDLTSIDLFITDQAGVGVATDQITPNAFHIELAGQTIEILQVIAPGEQGGSGKSNVYRLVFDQNDARGLVGIPIIRVLAPESSPSQFVQDRRGQASADQGLSIVLESFIIEAIVTPGILADLDSDGDVDDADFGQFFAAFSGPGNPTTNHAADLDGDGDVDDADFGLAFAAFTGPAPVSIPADLDGDSDVDDADFGLAFAAFTGPNNGPSSNPDADLDNDGDVDDADFGLSFAAFTGPLGSASVSDDEPQSLQAPATGSENALAETMMGAADGPYDGLSNRLMQTAFGYNQRMDVIRADLHRVRDANAGLSERIRGLLAGDEEDKSGDGSARDADERDHSGLIQRT